MSKNLSIKIRETKDLQARRTGSRSRHVLDHDCRIQIAEQGQMSHGAVENAFRFGWRSASSAAIQAVKLDGF